jgi:hypothetical protein
MLKKTSHTHDIIMYVKANEKVDFKFIAHDAFLE